jgi:outer membrane protein assembly factor BamB
MKIHIWASAVLIAVSSGTAAQAAESVVTYHNSLDRHGAYKVPGLTLAAAAGMHMDKSFHASLSGHVYAQPLFWKPAGAGDGEVIAATESNIVYALDAKSGAVVWHTQLAKSVPLSDLPCGNIDPEGITGTPVIDPAALEPGVIHVRGGAISVEDGAIQKRCKALSVEDGAIRGQHGTQSKASGAIR